MIKILNLRDRPEHLTRLAQWHHKQWSHLYPGSSIQQRIHNMQQHFNDDFIPRTFIALDDNLLGSAAILENDMETNPELTPWLASVFVVPEQRRKGIGSRLVLHVMDQSRQNGIKELYLFTPDKEHFYRRLGWNTITKELYHGEEVTIMKSRLSNTKPENLSIHD